jgi:uncharacterized membrane protein (DUF4010 family)
MESRRERKISEAVGATVVDVASATLSSFAKEMGMASTDVVEGAIDTSAIETSCLACPPRRH